MGHIFFSYHIYNSTNKVLYFCKIRYLIMRYLIYDDECNFCCNIMRILTSLVDISDVSCISLKSQKAKQLINYHNLQNVNSVIYLDNKGKVYIKAIAVLNVFRIMKFPYNLLYLFNIFPHSFLNFLYDFIAKNRMIIK